MDVLCQGIAQRGLVILRLEKEFELQNLTDGHFPGIFLQLNFPFDLISFPSLTIVNFFF